MTTARHRAIVAVLAITAAASAAPARPVATARLVSCGADDCLLVRGHRRSPDAAVRINGRPVDASGGNAWQVRLPLATVRDWSAPFARTLRVEVADAAGRSDAVPLPVGLLGHRLELASLIVRAR